MSNKPYAPWAGNPTQQGQEYITLVDIIGSSSFETPGNTPNSITLNLGVAYTGETYTKDALLFSPPGLMSVPVGPGSFDKSGNFSPSSTSVTGAQAVAYIRNDQWIVLGTRDTRVQNNAGNIGAGDTCLYGLIGNAKVVCKADSSVTMMTSDADGNNIQFTISPTGLYFVAPFGKITFDAAGFRVSNSAGATFNLMATSNAATGCNAIMMSGGTVSINSGMITLGTPTNTVLPLPVVYGVVPVTSPGIPIQGQGVGQVVMQAAASTSVFVGL